MSAAREPERLRALAPGVFFFEDLRAGDFWDTGSVTVSEAQITAFAGLSGDWFDVHVDDAFARSLGFPGRIAHGLLGLALIDGLLTRSPVRLEAVAALGWDWRFTAPLLPGDRIHAQSTIRSLRRTRKGDRGVAVIQIDVVKQDDAVVQAGDKQLLLASRGPEQPQPQ